MNKHSKLKVVSREGIKVGIELETINKSTVSSYVYINNTSN